MKQDKLTYPPYRFRLKSAQIEILSTQIDDGVHFVGGGNGSSGGNGKKDFNNPAGFATASASASAVAVVVITGDAVVDMVV